MRTLAKLLPVLLLVVLLGESSVRAHTRVQVEIIYLTYTYQQRPQPAMYEQLAAYCQSVEGSEESLVSLIDRWLEGKDRKQFTVDALQVTTAMGQEVEVVSQQTIPLQTQPLVQRVPHQVDVLPLGVNAIVRATEAKDQQIELNLRFGKRTLRELPPGEVVGNQDGQGVPGVVSTWMDMRPTLRPGVPHPQAGLIQNKNTAQGDATCENFFVMRARRVPVLRSE